MSQSESIEFVLSGKVDGVPMMPRTIVRQLTGPAEYAPSYDEEALNRFAAAGRKAWADVPDAAQWVRELRGDD